MRMSHLASIAFACSISLFSTVSFAQSPAEDGLCNELLHGDTPSLYGLCIAYWATQNNGNSDASSKILEKYVARKSGSDPDMPGLCPCWTATQLETWEGEVKGGGNGNLNACEGMTDLNAAGWSADYHLVLTYIDSPNSKYICAARAPSNSGSPANITNEDIGEIAYDSCYEDAQFSAIEVGCPIPN